MHDDLIERPAARFSRRTFVERFLVLAGGASLLAACAPQAPSAPAAATSAPATTAPATTGQANPTTAAAPAAGQQPRSGGTYTHGSVQEPDRFWSPFSGLVVSYEIANLTNASLTKID